MLFGEPDSACAFGNSSSLTGWRLNSLAVYRFQQIQPHIDALGNVQYLMAHVPDGHKGWGGGIEEGTYDQFEEYVKRVDDFQVGLVEFMIFACGLRGAPSLEHFPCCSESGGYHYKDNSIQVRIAVPDTYDAIVMETQLL